MTYRPRNIDMTAVPPGGPPYLMSDRILVAVDIALATRQPLLIAGPPGSGKTSLAEWIRHAKQWRLLAHTVTSRTRLEDMQADFDTLRRLNDAQGAIHGRPLPPDWTYLRPGVLWWAFDAEGAARRGASDEELKHPLAPPPLPDPATGPPGAGGTVVLLDEVDKADPDLPNDLLEPLDRGRFQLPLAGRKPVAATGRTALVLTTNGERELPPAFLRRCVVLELEDAQGPRLRAIARAHVGPERLGDDQLDRVLGRVAELRAEARMEGWRPPSTAEVLGALQALAELPELERGTVWGHVEALLLRKTPAAGTA